MNETIRMAFEALRANRLRSVLTLLGMAIGVFSVIASVTAVAVLDGTLMDSLASMGTQTIVIGRLPMDGSASDEDRRRQQITYEQAERLRERASIAASVSPSVSTYNREVRTREEATDPNVQISGVDESWARNNGWELSDGRFLSEADVRAGRNVAILGSTVKNRLFGDRTPLGAEVRIDGRRFTVVGVLDAKSGGLGFGDANNLVAVPISRAIPAFNLQDYDVSIDVRAATAAQLAETRDETVGLFRAIRRLAPEADDDFSVFTSEQATESLKSFTNALSIGGAGIGMIALLAAGVGVMNIMLVSVTERTREIGIRKSLGATRADIRRQFLVEAVVLCQIGGLTGIALGVLGGNALAALIKTAPAFPWAWATVAIVGVTVVALVFGVYPATKAARLSPIEALRYE